MEVASLLAAGWVWQAEASWPDIPPTAPMTAMASSITTAALTVSTMAAEPRSAAGCGVGARMSDVPGAGGLNVVDGPAGRLRGEGDREAAYCLAGAAGAGDGLADGDGEGDRAGGQVPGLRCCGGAGGGLAGVVALGEDAGDVSGPGQGGVQAAAGHGAQPGQPGGRWLPPGPGAVSAGEPACQGGCCLEPGRAEGQDRGQPRAGRGRRAGRGGRVRGMPGRCRAGGRGLQQGAAGARRAGSG